MAKRVSDFPASVVRVLRDRAAGICQSTHMQSADHWAAHRPGQGKDHGRRRAYICAASPNGPRYDPAQTSAERKGIKNAIWTCEQCGKEIDKDTSRYTREELQEWKIAHERYVATVGGMGFREAFLTLPTTDTESQVARRLFAFFQDRRVLHELLDRETPVYTLRSVERIREELWKAKSDLPYGSELSRKIDFMRQSCIAFLDDAGHLDSAGRIGSSSSQWQRLEAALGAFRKVMGLHIMEIGQKFKFGIPNELATIIPS